MKNKLKILKNEKKKLNIQRRAQNLAKRYKIKNTEFIRKVQSPIEVMFYKAFIDLNTSVTIRSQVGFKPYIVDFVLQYYDKKIIVEADGKEYHLDKEYEFERENYLKTLGFRIIRFTGAELHKNAELCALKAYSYLYLEEEGILTNLRYEENPNKELLEEERLKEKIRSEIEKHKKQQEEKRKIQLQERLKRAQAERAAKEIKINEYLIKKALENQPKKSKEVIIKVANRKNDTLMF